MKAHPPTHCSPHVRLIHRSQLTLLVWPNRRFALGTGLLALMGSIGGTLLVIAISWLVVRPLLGGSLLVLALRALVFSWMRVRKHRGVRVPAAAPVPG